MHKTCNQLYYVFLQIFNNTLGLSKYLLYQLLMKVELGC